MVGDSGPIPIRVDGGSGLLRTRAVVEEDTLLPVLSYIDVVVAYSLSKQPRPSPPAAAAAAAACSLLLLLAMVCGWCGIAEIGCAGIGRGEGDLSCAS